MRDRLTSEFKTPVALRNWRCVLLLLIASLLPAVGHSGEIVLGMSAAFTGPSRALGIELYRGTMAYLDEVNRTGGVHGNNLVLKAYDDAYDPNLAIQNTIRLIDKDQAFLLLDYVGTPTVTRVLPLLKFYAEQDILLFFPYTGAQPQRQPPYAEYVFNLRASYNNETAGLVDQFVGIGRNKIAVFYQADAYGRGGWEGVKAALARHALKIQGEATYRRGQGYHASMARQVEILKAAEPQAIISVCSYAACAALIRDIRQSGWDVPVANLSFAGSEAIAALLSEEHGASPVEYTRFLVSSQVVPSYVDTELPAIQEYRQLMDGFGAQMPQAVVGSDYQPLKYSFASLEGFLNAKLLVRILRDMGPSPQRADIRATAESLRDVDLGTGTTISFGPNQHQASNQVYFTVLENGEFVPMLDWRTWAAGAE